MVTTLMIGTLTMDTMEEVNVLQPLGIGGTGYIIPLKCVQGLMYMDIRPFTDDETEKLPILVHLTRDIPWDPSRYDSTLLSDRCIAIYPNDYNGVNRRRELFHCN